MSNLELRREPLLAAPLPCGIDHSGAERPRTESQVKKRRNWTPGDGAKLALFALITRHTRDNDTQAARRGQQRGPTNCWRKGDNALLMTPEVRAIRLNGPIGGHSRASFSCWPHTLAVSLFAAHPRMKRSNLFFASFISLEIVFGGRKASNYFISMFRKLFSPSSFMLGSRAPRK